MNRHGYPPFMPESINNRCFDVSTKMSSPILAQLSEKRLRRGHELQSQSTNVLRG